MFSNTYKGITKLLTLETLFQEFSLSGSFFTLFFGRVASEEPSSSFQSGDWKERENVEGESCSCYKLCLVIPT